MVKKRKTVVSKDVSKSNSTTSPSETLSQIIAKGRRLTVAPCDPAASKSKSQRSPYQWETSTSSGSQRAAEFFATITHEPRVLIKLRLDPTVWNHSCTTQFAAAMDCFEQFLRYNAKLCPGGWFAWTVDVSDRQMLRFHLAGSLGRVDGDLKIEALTRRWLALTGSTNSKMLRAKAVPDHAWRFLKKRAKSVSKQKRLTAPANTLYGISRPRNAGVPQTPTTYTVTPKTLRQIHRMLEREVYASNVKGFRKHIRHERYSFTQCGPAVVKKIIRIAEKGMK